MGSAALAVDLDDAAECRFVQDLARGADIVVEDHRPGKVAAWGLDEESIRAANPDVVYVSISAYGQQGSRRDRLGTDAAVAAHLGLMSEWGGKREGPIFLGHPAIDYATALLGSAGTLACVRARLVSGQGDHLDVSLLDGAMALYTMNWWTQHAGGSSVDKKGADGSLQFGYKRLLLRMFDCKGGGLIQVHTGAAGAFDRAMEVFGLGDLVTKQSGDVQMSSLLTDADLEIMAARLPDIMRTRTVDEWLEVLWANQIAALPVGQPGESLDDAQVRHAGVVVEIDDPVLGRIETLGPTVLMSASPGGIDFPARPLDADGDAIRRDGWGSVGLAPIDGPPLAAPMQGVRIIEFASFFAAPYGDRLLSDLGADVVKIEPMEGDPMRPLTEYFEGANRGKQSIAVNLKHADAKAIVKALVRDADVVQHNLRPGAAERLGIDDASLRPFKSDLVYHYLPGYGSSGPKSRLQSFAPLLSGMVGTFANGAGFGNRPHQVFGNEDYYNGLLGASACLLGLIHRQRTGEGQFVESPQLHSSMFTISEFFKREGRIEGVVPRMGGQLYGWTAGYRIYECLDAWICVQCTHDHEVEALADTVIPGSTVQSLTVGEANVAAPEEGKLADLLAYHFVERTVDDWVATLSAAGVPVEAVAEEPWMPAAMFHDPELLADGRVRSWEHPMAGPVRTIGDLLRPGRSGTARRGSAPLHGEHTRAVLTSMGRSVDEIDALVAQRVVLDGAPSALDSNADGAPSALDSNASVPMP